ncbi:cache domain-containing sensor histidine kinase [Cohnella caldifontis]|uniref:cache domain-containing sensor histidine kinase n=1 Tax=Cohnella caldifontis TaxID=3027471 RepID=UPI0023ECF190|nr:sensor histidine kinase [Cohnella sp. YIM B05605]
MIRRLFENKNRLFNKMFALVSLSVFIPVVLLGILSYEKSKKQLSTVTSQFLEDNLQLNARQINAFFRSVEMESEKMIASRDLQVLLGSKPPANQQEEYDFINRMIEIISSRKGFNELYVFPKDISKYPRYRQLIKLNKIDPSPTFFSRIFDLQNRGMWYHVWDEGMDQPIFIYVRAIRSSYYYEPLGVLAIQIPNNAVREMLSPPSSFKNYMFYMLDEHHNVISHPASASFNEKRISDRVWSKAETPLGIEGWRLVAAVPHKDLTGAIAQIQSFTFWIVFISLILMTILLVVIVRSFTLSIKDIVNHMNRVKMGMLQPFPFHHGKKDEVGQLVRGYNQMISGMNDLLDTTRDMEADKRRLELQTLNHQINPHFFYNTLDAIKWKSEKAGVGDIAAMVMKLANLLRFSLNNGNERTTVEREIEHARLYLDIEQIRSQRSFQVYFQVEPEIVKLQVIKLILQPLVENAVKHGVNRLPEGKGKILVTAKRRDNDLLFIIEDNGPGLQQPLSLEETSGTNDQPRGIGLINVHKRLRLHFGVPYGVVIDTENAAGFRVSVRHPVADADADRE